MSKNKTPIMKQACATLVTAAFLILSAYLMLSAVDDLAIKQAANDAPYLSALNTAMVDSHE